MSTTTLLKLKPKNLLTHPRNMRRFYPSEQVREMANSILAVNGVLQPLIVVKADEAHRWIVVDGNMRLAAARLLEDRCPQLDCRVVDQSEAEQMVAMIVANKARYEVDPVSEGLHYKALQAEGMSVRDISKQTGIYEIRISNRRALADLPESIQKLIVDGKLPSDVRSTRALLGLPTEKMIKLAERLSQNPNIKIKTIIAAAEKLGAAKRVGGRPRKSPAAEISGASSGKGRTCASDLREAAKKACHSCNQYEGELRKTAEPAWAMVVHAADKTCTACPLKDMQNICGSCPAVQLLKRLVNRE
ncbi:MAG: ParB/RepB/Spo0J family partition protein [Elusimicrobia bacterium]|nr:ParB/RepB/Spo0J family partition protein [Elusimicrobiota bacterium]